MRLPPTPAQLRANRLNAALSTGPQTAEGKGAVARNAVRHGLTGAFMVLPWESREEFDRLAQDLAAEHRPATATEKLLVSRMAQHHWLSQRALTLQGTCFHSEAPTCAGHGDEARLAVFLRYQATHERAFFQCLRELAALRAAQRKSAQTEEKTARGFVSQQAREARDEAAEDRRQELHQLRVRAARQRLRPAVPDPALPMAA